MRNRFILAISLLCVAQLAWAQVNAPVPAVENLRGLSRQLTLKPEPDSRFLYSLNQGRTTFPQIYLYVKTRDSKEDVQAKDLSVGLVALKHLESVTLQGSVSYDRFRYHLLKTMTEGEDIRTVSTRGGLNFKLNSSSALNVSLTVNRTPALQATTTGQVALLHRWSDRWMSRFGFSVLHADGLSSMVSVSLAGAIDP